jgi:hypothetical protein
MAPIVNLLGDVGQIPGMDSRQVVARFEAERQALALMDHPNIAKVLDGSQTTKPRLPRSSLGVPRGDTEGQRPGPRRLPF